MEGRNLGAGFVANCKHGESQRLRRLPARLVQTTQAQASVAGGPRSLPGMGFGNHVAANARRRGSGALSPFPEQISDGPQVGCRTGIIRAGRLERPRVLPARSYAARGSKARREGISGKVSTRQRRIAPPTRHRALHCRGDRQHRVRGTDSRGRRECGASPRANERETAQRRTDLEHGKPPPGSGPPRQLQCLLCPVSGFCAARGELQAEAAKPRQKKRTIFFGLARRNGHVLLVQRGKTESLMPGMWELPELPSRARAKRLLSLRHSITVTDYQVNVMEIATPRKGSGRWIARSRLASLPLTGLARKILQRAELL